MREAIGLLKRALEIDPSYAPAAALIGECRVVQRSHGWGAVSGAEIAESVCLARQAIQWGKDDPDVLWMASFSLSLLAGEHARAASVIDRALALNPNSAHAWEAKGWIASYQNQPCPAIEAFERAIRLSPLDPLGGYFSGGLALANLAAGRYEEASDWADRASRELPRYTSAIRTKAVSCAHLGRIDEAREWLGRLLDILPASTIGGWKSVTFLPPEIVAKYVEGLRKAGLPEE